MWFAALRGRARRRGTLEMVLGYRVRKVLATVLIAAGGVGLAVWPVLWTAHFRHIWMGTHASGHPMFTIYLGFLPFALLLVIGIALLPYRRWMRGHHAKQPPKAA